MTTIDGIISGISTKELIQSMMTLESGPQALLKTKKANTDALVTALQSLNTKVASLAEHATKAAKPTAWSAVAASITQAGSGSTKASGASAVTSEGAAPGSLTFRVDAKAAAQSSLVTLPDTLDPAPVFTLTRGGENITITAVSNSLPDIVEAFNASGTGVKATLVTVDETDGAGQPTGAQTKLLQLTSTQTGAAQSFSLSYEGSGGTQAVALDHLTEAADARITLFPGTTAERIRTSASNTFEGLMTGVNVTVTEITAADAQPLQLTVTRDDTAATKLASGLVDNLNAILSDISTRSTSSSATDSDGNDILLPGVFGGNSAIRMLQQRLLTEGSGVIDGVAAADVGIVVGRDGSFTFDSAVFDAAMAASPERTRTVLIGLSEKLSAVATANSDPIDGVLSQEITSRKGVSDDLNTRINSWDDRLEARQQSLLRQFTAMEKILGELQGQASYLTNIINSMNSSTT